MLKDFVFSDGQQTTLLAVVALTVFILLSARDILMAYKNTGYSHWNFSVNSFFVGFATAVIYVIVDKQVFFYSRDFACIITVVFIGIAIVTCHMEYSKFNDWRIKKS